MQVWKTVKVIVEGKEAKLNALFDSGSRFTVMGYTTLRDRFGEVSIKLLPKPIEAVLINGQKVKIYGFVDSMIIIEEYDYIIADRIYISKDIVKEVVVQGRIVRLPDLIIGAPTMETWGIELSLEKGDIIVRGSFIL
ncbi:MAG: hypothetical protein DRO15_03950 [Thermoprotei archaeon]|nr:MAG: hypothetical protein DRO15_03950 [Thermoprotei archaeon]